MNIRIDEDVPLPEPDKPSTWVSGPTAKDYRPKLEGEWISEAAPIKPDAWESIGKRYPAETTYDAKGVPTADCFLVGGPLNGRHGPIVGEAKVVELEIYGQGGEVTSVELYSLGDNPTLTFRYHVGSKEP